MKISKSLIILIFLIRSVSGCTQKKHNKQQGTRLTKTQVFEYKNDTITQTLVVVKISSDTLKVNLNMSNKLSNNSCSLIGLAIHDTVGDYLQAKNNRDRKF